jgi:hypothetical protein
MNRILLIFGVILIIDAILSMIVGINEAFLEQISTALQLDSLLLLQLGRILRLFIAIYLIFYAIMKGK